MSQEDEDDTYQPSGRVGEPPVEQTYVIHLVCGHNVSYSTFPNLKPLTGDSVYCYVHGQLTLVASVE